MLNCFARISIRSNICRHDLVRTQENRHRPAKERICCYSISRRNLIERGCELTYPGELDIPGFLLLNCGVLLLYFGLTGISFFASCLFNETKKSLALGAGLPVGFLLLQMISDTGEKFDFLSFFSLYTLFDPARIISGEGYLLSFIILTVIGIVLYLAGIITFARRDLPL